jgi:tRNA dimethylallyltransferase
LDRFEFPGTDPGLRRTLESELAVLGPAALHDRLRETDPVAAATILPTNGRRIVRALEVIELSGRPYSASLPAKQYAYDEVVQIGVEVPRDELDARIAARVDRMWRSGFVDEVRRLEARGLRSGHTASRALGYAQVLRFLAGEWTEAHARAETIRATRRFARRQDSWFGKDDRIRWLGYHDPDLVARAVALVR